MSNEAIVRKAAVFSDIHSNYYTFKACFEDAKLHGADCFIFLGDYISDLADARKTLDLVYEINSASPTFCLRGNRERYMLECKEGKALFSRGSKSGSLLYTYNQLREQDFLFFESLRIYDSIQLSGVNFEIAHAVRDNDRYYFEGGDENIQTVFSEMHGSYLLTGHSHKQYVERYQGKTILNPGSIGVPQDCGNEAQYAILEIENGTVTHHFHRVPYDINSTIARQFESGLVDYAKYWAVSILYDIITGEEYTMKLLQRVFQYADGNDTAVHNERIWHRAAEEMGMKFTKGEIMDFFERTAIK